MRHHKLAWGWPALLLSLPLAAQSPAEDEAWIERAMQARPAAASGGAASEQPTVAFSELASLRGVSLAVTLRDGRVRRGVLERADRGSLVLQQTLTSGRFAFSVPRGDVARIVREDR